ncbi:MAG: hypothetical protein [Olavius algarvensis Gamma 1 endosymbiont]|nr:MAG: hypothetical protein [Olavius algarvensis Gamma 1 endosymbiont]
MIADELIYSITSKITTTPVVFFAGSYVPAFRLFDTSSTRLQSTDYADFRR